MPWMMHEGKWIEVFKEGTQHFAVDARISRQPLYGSVMGDKPDWEPSTPAGIRISVKYKRVLQAVEECERTLVESEAMWGEIDEVDDPFVAAVEITEVSGFGHTHICGYCMEYATTNPSKHAPCKGCGKTGFWDEWSGSPPALGPMTPPDWAAKKALSRV
jgi:hypothetical protein